MRKVAFFVSSLAVLLVGSAGPTRAASVVINNGLAPPNPDNVIDDDRYLNDDVYVRNVGCPPGWPAGRPYDPCPFPGGPTEVALVNGGYIGWGLGVYDSSTLTMSGGGAYEVYASGSSTLTMSGGVLVNLFAWESSRVTVDGGSIWQDLAALDFSTVIMNSGAPNSLEHVHAWDFSTLIMNDGGVWLSLAAFGSSTVTMKGGSVGSLEAYDSATIAMSGGFVDGWGGLYALDSSTIWIVGEDFEVDGASVPYGDLTALTGTLTGTLASGDPIDNLFSQGGGWATGTLTLVPAIPIDIRPWSEINPVNPMGRGVVPVAILGSDTFDVVDVDVTTLAFGPNGAAPTHKKGGHLQDVDGDGFTDLVSHYPTQETGIAFGDAQACVTGRTFDGVPLAGCDSISTLPNCGNGYQAALLLPPVVWIGGRRQRKRARGKNSQNPWP